MLAVWPQVIQVLTTLVSRRTEISDASNWVRPQGPLLGPGAQVVHAVTALKLTGGEIPEAILVV